MVLDVFVFVLCILRPNSVAPDAVTLRAEAWLNPFEIHVPEDRTFVILFFSTAQDRELKSWVERLNKIDRRDDVVVLGLSVESKERLVRFVDESKVEFAVGAKSKAYKKFSVKRFPEVIVLSPPSRGKAAEPEAIDLDRLEHRFPLRKDTVSIESGEFDEDSSIDELRLHAKDDLDRNETLRALGLLRRAIPPSEFLGFCDQLLQTEDDIFRRGIVRFQRQLADPNIPDADKEPITPPASLALHQMRETPTDPQWDSLREYTAHIVERSVEELAQDHLAHLGDSPPDLMIRRMIPEAIAATSDKKKARELLMQILPMETDAMIRMSTVMSFCDVAAPGDVELASFLEQQLQTERNVRTTRPAMEYVIRYLRTGEE